MRPRPAPCVCARTGRAKAGVGTATDATTRTAIIDAVLVPSKTVTYRTCAYASRARRCRCWAQRRGVSGKQNSMRTRCDMNDKLTVTSKLQLLFMKLHLLEVVCEAVLRTWRICTSSRCQHICDINNDLNNTRARFRSSDHGQIDALRSAAAGRFRRSPQLPFKRFG